MRIQFSTCKWCRECTPTELKRTIHPPVASNTDLRDSLTSQNGKREACLLGEVVGSGGAQEVRHVSSRYVYLSEQLFAAAPAIEYDGAENDCNAPVRETHGHDIHGPEQQS